MAGRPPATLITGASAGIGEELTRVFARNGHDLLLAARRRDRLEALAAEMRDAYGVRVTVYQADLATDTGATDLHAAVQKDRHTVGILVNNAGLLAEGRFLDVELETHTQILAVNTRALLELCHLFGRDMGRRGRGRVLNVCSTSAFLPVPNLATYAASKAMVLSLSEALSIEWERLGITVTALCPGFVETDMTRTGDGKHMALPLVPLLSAREVAEQGYRATMKGRPVYINGMGNRLVQTLSAHQPRWVMHRISRLLEYRTSR